MSNDKGGTASDERHGKSKPLFVIHKNKMEAKPGEYTYCDSDNLFLTNSNISPNSCVNVFTKSWTLRQPLFQNLRNKICNTKTIKGLSENPNDNSKVENEVKKEVLKLCSDFPIYNHLNRN